MKHRNWLTLGITLLIFFYALQPVIDPDTGWHLATGRYIFENKTTPQQDLFSYSLPDHPYIAHSWAFDLLMFAIFMNFGQMGLAFLYASLTTTSMLIWANLCQKNDGARNAHFFLPFIAYGVIEITGQRPQAVTVLGLSILFSLLASELNTRKKWLIPLLFLVWSNLHGGVVLGIAILFLWLFIHHIYKTKTNNLGEWTKTAIFSWIATLVNPYSYKIYSFALGMVTNSTAHIYNSDWVPLFSSRLDPTSMTLRITIIAFSLVAILDNKDKVVEAILALLFTLLSLKSLRFLIPLLGVVAPLLISTISRATTNAQKKSWFLPVCIVLISSFFYESFIDKTKLLCANNFECYGKLAKMPAGAVAYIKTNGLAGNFFNYYTWGGYLEWELPNSKFFIDGRMDNFFVDGKSFMEEFVDVDRQREGWYERLIAYKTDGVIMPSNWQKQKLYLVEKNWKILFEDDVVTVMKL